LGNCRNDDEGIHTKQHKPTLIVIYRKIDRLHNGTSPCRRFPAVSRKSGGFAARMVPKPTRPSLCSPFRAAGESLIPRFPFDRFLLKSGAKGKFIGMGELAVSASCPHSYPGIDFSGESEVLSPSQPPIHLPDGPIVAFLLSLHEEGGFIYLFLKYLGRSICVQVRDACDHLGFLPVDGRRSELLDEIGRLAASHGGSLSSFEFATHRYVFENKSVPRECEWLTGSITGACNVLDFPDSSPNYRCVFRRHSSLSEHFVIEHQITGPQWIEFSGAEQMEPITSIPAFSLANSRPIRVLTDMDETPLVNLCSFAVQATGSHLCVISTRIITNCDLQTLSGRPVQRTFTVGPAVTAAVCKSESDLVSSFLSVLDEFDVDLIASFDFKSDLKLIYGIMCDAQLLGWWRLGRLRRGFLAPPATVSRFAPLVGRVGCCI
jgi:hypothetical protein